MGSEFVDAVTISKSKSPSSSGKLFPPGFRFHPTDEELVLYYLKRKICRRSLKPDIIGEVDVYKWDPAELPGLSKLKTGDRQWFFFSPRDRKYPNGGRSSRATMNGYWKATGKDRIIKRKISPAGIKKTLVYYQGRAPSGLRTDWVMHEYTLDEEELKRCPIVQEHFALYKVFKKSGPGPKNGEQYGALFVEEEWDDDECLDVESLMVEKQAQAQAQAHEEDEMGFSSEIIEFLNKVIDEPEILPPLPNFSELPPVYYIQSLSSEVEKDFLEMDDLVGPEPRDCSVTDFDTGSGLDFYNGSDPIGPPYVTLQGGWVNLDCMPENSGLVSEVVNDELPINYDLWNHHDQGDSCILTSQTVPEPVSDLSSGVIIEENPDKPGFHTNQCPENTIDNKSESWFSSALWAFVDSIPTTPASASESSALVNRAFERMSSFSRGRNFNPAAATTTERLEKPKPKLLGLRSSKGVLFLSSVIGVLCGVLWVFIRGSSRELWSRFVWW
ncbi:hypothetical protein R6Q59_031667 [Mikania micrantha]